MLVKLDELTKIKMAQNSSKRERLEVERAQIEIEAKSQTLWSRMLGYVQALSATLVAFGTLLTECILFRGQRNIHFLELESRLTRHLLNGFDDGRARRRKNHQ